MTKNFFGRLEPARRILKRKFILPRAVSSVRSISLKMSW